MFYRVFTAFVMALIVACAPALAQDNAASTVAGRILDTRAGLPVPGATVQLRHGDTVIASGTTDAGGRFAINGVPPGDYTVFIEAGGYQPAFTTLHVEAGAARVEFQTALTPGQTGLRQIAVVSTNSTTALASTATINENLNPAILQDQNYMRAGDALGTLPFVTAVTSNSIGDDENIQLRGFDPSESVALIDGHPVGPLGACPAANNQVGTDPCPYNTNGSLFDYQLAQFWGMSNISVILGSGATGLYGVPTLAGAVNFETLNPTPTDHATVLQGYGDLSKAMTGLSYTGTAGRLGFAAAYGVEGSAGELEAPQLQSAMLSGAAFNKELGGKDQADCGQGTGSPSYTLYGSKVPPSLLPADIAACTTAVGSGYLNKNALAKFTYQVDSKTSVLVSFYGANSYDDGIGNGENYYMSYDQMLAQANGYVASGGYNFKLKSGPLSGKETTCTNSIAVLYGNSNGFECLTATQFASQFSGPWDKGPGGWHNDLNQDYHARITRQIGAGTLTIDGYLDNYDEVNDKPDVDQYLAAEQDIFFTHGGLISDDYAGLKNDFSFGVSFQHQMHETNQFLPSGVPCLGDCFLGFPFGDTDYFIHDTYEANRHFSVFADLTLDDSKVSNTTSFDPRLSLVYRPDSADVFRVTGGAASISPDPILYTGGTYPAGPVASYSCINPGGSTSCQAAGATLNGFSPSALACDSPVPVLQGYNAVKPEQADDLEAAIAHRFPNQATVELDAYDTIETNPIISDVLPLSALPAAQLAAFNSNGYFQTALNTLNAGTTGGGCGSGGYTINNLGVIIPTNAGQAQYRGLNLYAKVPLTRQLEIDGNYTVQTSFYYGLPNTVLINNAGYINGQQFYGIPPQTATLGLGYNNIQGAWTARISGYYVGNNNSYYRPAFWYANANISKTVGPITLNLGISNLFNNDAGIYQLTNLGTPIPQNEYYPGVSTNSELSLLPRQVWLTTTIHI